MRFYFYIFFSSSSTLLLVGVGIFLAMLRRRSLLFVAQTMLFFAQYITHSRT